MALYGRISADYFFRHYLTASAGRLYRPPLPYRCVCADGTARTDSWTGNGGAGTDHIAEGGHMEIYL